MTQAEKLISIARAEIGVAEDPLGSNNTKYGKAYGYNGVPWCMEFVWWDFREAGLSHLFYDGKKTASCTTLMNWAKSVNQFVTRNYKAGDVFLFQFDDDAYSEHTGIYTGEKDSRGRYLVIEGNHNDRVEQVARSDSELHGAFRPKWDNSNSQAEEKRPDGGVELPEIKYGDKGATVKAMQILLMGYGYKLPKYGADGEYGSETRTALKKYQLNKGLTVDGVCGDKTWAKLLGI